jgi:hypothetical protein
MRIGSSRLAFAALLGLAALSLSVTACTGSCNCPYGGGFDMVNVPAAASSPITAVSAPSPCTATASTNDVSVSTNSAGTCRVLVQLQNGDAYAFSIQFQPVTFSGACDCGGLRVLDAPTPALTDAGID